LSRSGLPSKLAVDANFLVALVDPELNPDDRARIDHLLARVDKAKSLIVIPMPALAEFLVGADQAGIEVMNKLERKAFIDLAPFDRAAAFECAQLDRAAIGGGALAAKQGRNNGSGKKDGVDAHWQKIKIDRQIVAIAKARGALLIVSRDDGVRSNALRVGIQALTVQELELPESAKQGKLELVVPVRPGALPKPSR
jgi:predicted nucleic acid-binding protein